MSRKEKFINNKYEKKGYKLICKIVFMCIMIVITSIGVYKVDYEVNKMLGNKDENTISKYINIFD